MATRTVTRKRVAGAPPGSGGAVLCVVHPRALAQRILLGATNLVLGRQPDDALGRIVHETVSRRHLAVEWDGERHRARDLDSHNGSRLDGRDLEDEPAPLRDGSVVRLGDVLIVCERAAEAPDAPEVSREAVPGASAAAVELRAALGAAGPDVAPVLLLGETGTGKEHVARELHRLSGRGRFVAVNCAALSPQLIESQLFGHAKGAFTGAAAAHEGLFRAAHGGTLFLDEIGELPLELQPKLLRVLQEHEVQPVGETVTHRVDVRVVAATLQDLVALTKQGRFRLDLYARLALWEVPVPPLRERRSDIADWIDRLGARWQESRSETDARPLELDADVLELVLCHDWPDNLRGLDRLVHRLLSRRSGVLGAAAVERWLRASGVAERERDQPSGTRGDAEAPPARPSGRRREAPSREELEAVLERNGWSVRATAKHFDRDRRQIRRWMEQHGLKAADED
jgi:transcriptional regulator with GAF, ATPase, and Fis domain